MVNNMSPRSGKMVHADGGAENLVDIYKALGANAQGGRFVQNANNMSPRSAEIIGSDGRVYDEAELIKSIQSGSEGGTTNYNELTNKPKINGVELAGDKSAEDLGFVRNKAASSNNVKISPQSGGDVSLEAYGDVLISSTDNDLTLHGNSSTVLEGDESIDIKSVNGSLIIDAGDEVNVNAASSVNINAESATNINGDELNVNVFSQVNIYGSGFRGLNTQGITIDEDGIQIRQYEGLNVDVGYGNEKEISIYGEGAMLDVCGAVAGDDGEDKYDNIILRTNRQGEGGKCYYTRGENLLSDDYEVARLADIKAQNITYPELKALRDNSQLVPGREYRITDYVTTTVQSDTQSAGNVFDVIVVADSPSVLNENARAVQHDGDTYFDGQNLNAWKLKYCLDNDTERFAWADSTNGKGVIWELEDEYGNRCGYDFKNILMKFYKITATSGSVTGLIGKYLASREANIPNGTLLPRNCTISTSDFEWRYTFDLFRNNTHEDYSLNKYSTNDKYCYGNEINAMYRSSKQIINIISFRNTLSTSPCYGNKFGNNNYNNVFGYSCRNNIFGDNSYKNVVEDTFSHNNVNNDFYSNIFGSFCYNNIFGADFCNNDINVGFSYNCFGSDWENNEFARSCFCNRFGDVGYLNRFDESCSYNTFGNYCCGYNTPKIFNNKSVKIGFDGDSDYGFLQGVDIDADTKKIFIYGTVYNNHDVDKDIEITANFYIQYDASDGSGFYDVDQTEQETLSVPANDKVDFKIETDYAPWEFQTFTVEADATFIVGSETVTANARYEW